MSTKTAKRAAKKASKAADKRSAKASAKKAAAPRKAASRNGGSKKAASRKGEVSREVNATSKSVARNMPAGRATGSRKRGPAAAAADLATAVIETMTRAVEQFGTHVVQAGDSLSKIAQNSRVTLEVLLGANPDIENPDSISVGQQIRIPLLSTGPDGSNGDGAGGASAHETTAAAAASGGSAALNAILFEAETAGASDRTARQDKLPQKGVKGVRASQAMAELDRRRVMAHKAKFIEAGARFGLPPALLAAIASRESRGGAVLKNGFGDGGHGFGLMQVDDRNGFGIVKEGGPSGLPHIIQASGILLRKLKDVRGKFPSLSPVRQLQTAVSRYNGGAGKAFPNSDQGTTGGDYMSDTWERARHYASVESWDEAAGARGLAGTRSAGGAATRSTRGAGTRSTRAADGDDAAVFEMATSTRAFNFLPAPSLEDVRAGRQVLRHGHRGDAVSIVQRLLGTGVDSRFGDGTKRAVEDFQRARGLGVDGRVGRLTLAALEGTPASDTSSTATTGAATTTTGTSAPADSFVGDLSRIDPRKKTDHVHPLLKQRLAQLDAALAARGMQARITDGLRTFAHQDAIFAQGRQSAAAVNALRKKAGLGAISAAEAGRKVTGVKGGFSNHNYGLAVDMYPVVNGQIILDPAKLSGSAKQHFFATQTAIGEEAERLGMTWGGRWKMKDMPHVQLFPLNEMTPETCLQIFRSHGDSLDAVWAEVTRRLRG